MSTLPAVTMQDLELEHAELLPSRETLNCWSGGVSRSFNNQFALLSGNNVASGNNIAVQVGLGNSANQGASTTAVGNSIG